MLVGYGGKEAVEEEEGASIIWSGEFGGQVNIPKFGDASMLCIQ